MDKKTLRASLNKASEEQFLLLRSLIHSINSLFRDLRPTHINFEFIQDDTFYTNENVNKMNKCRYLLRKWGTHLSVLEKYQNVRFSELGKPLH